MTPAKDILRLIENVSPNNESALDEINDKVCIYLMGISRRQYMGNSQYCSSRDALKKIRPDGWNFLICGVIDRNIFNASAEAYKKHPTKAGRTYPNFSCSNQKEELAELWCIISAIAHERGEHDLAKD